MPETYTFRNFPATLFAYVPYAFWIESYKWGYDTLFHNIAWKLFYPTSIHLENARNLSKIKGKNVVVTGYPLADIFLDIKRPIQDPWKIKDLSVKRIIWAPHHSINESDSLNYSSFLENYQFMLDLAAKYKETIQIAFKPHPILRRKLYNHPRWGKEKTDLYYNKWDKLPNGQLEEGDYIDLFLTSDAMFHDSSSFTVEYHYTGKPVMFLTKNKEELFQNLCEFGKLALNMHYFGSTPSEIENFIIEVVVGENDSMYSQRKHFFEKFLLPPHNLTANQNILNSILSYIE